MRKRGKRTISQGPIPDSYWVKPGKLLAGEYPASPRKRVTRHKLRRLLSAGVTFFLDLTEEGEHGLKPYVPLLHKEADGTERSIKHCRISISDGYTPTASKMRKILDVIDNALEAGHVVYIHCYGGIGRAGTVVGCYLVQHGMSGWEALQEIARLRKGTPDGLRVSPETVEQRNLVRRWFASGSQHGKERA